jgi:hypothetical protein
VTTNFNSTASKASNKAMKAAPPQQRRPQAGPRQASSIGIRRMPSSNALRQAAHQPNASAQRLSAPLPALDEDHALRLIPSKSSGSSTTKVNGGRFAKARSALQSRIPFWGSKDKGKTAEADDAAAQEADNASLNYTSGMVDVLDTIGTYRRYPNAVSQLMPTDPEVATLTSLTNMQNSLFIPNLPFLNRRPTYDLHRRPSESKSLEDMNRTLAAAQQAQAEAQATPRLRRTETESTMATVATIDSQLSESRYAVLPHGTDLEGWTKHDKKEVNDHVRHMLHSKRSKFKRTMRGFGQYVRRRKYYLNMTEPVPC